MSILRVIKKIPTETYQRAKICQTEKKEYIGIQISGILKQMGKLQKENHKSMSHQVASSIYLFPYKYPIFD